MTTPARYADWSQRADPKCPICRGMGYARYRQDDGLSVGQRVVQGLQEPVAAFEGGCRCLAAPQSDLARQRMANWVEPRP